MEEALIGAMSGAVAAGAAIRNMTMNVTDIIEWAKKMDPAYDAKVKFWNSVLGGGGPNPIEEAEGWADAQRAKLAANQKKLDKQREADKKADEIKNNPGAAPNDPTLPYLSRIAIATEKTADFTAGTIGGSAIGDRSFNSVNINRLSGGGSRNARKAVQALMALGSDAAQNLADSRGVTS